MQSAALIQVDDSKAEEKIAATGQPQRGLALLAKAARALWARAEKLRSQSSFCHPAVP